MTKKEFDYVVSMGFRVPSNCFFLSNPWSNTGSLVVESTEAGKEEIYDAHRNLQCKNAYRSRMTKCFDFYFEEWVFELDFGIN